MFGSTENPYCAVWSIVLKLAPAQVFSYDFSGLASKAPCSVLSFYTNCHAFPQAKFIKIPKDHMVSWCVEDREN